ncbi:MAG: response regulator [Kofleriaceae bacterium]|nr:response regulator [Myxococcales bacterium]MCB9560377.1 response regulator [Kofleriaceae bacterium]MCB9571694.1 response regulator [Kofleriaceae bacterium]
MPTTDKPRLLVVDDEPDMLDFVERVMRRRYQVTRCASAEEAVAELDRHAFEVLITDQKMPRVSGLELLARIAGAHPSLVRVLLSGFTDVPDIQRAVERSQVHAYVLKPVDSQRLLAAVAQAYEVRDGAPFVPPEEG